MPQQPASRSITSAAGNASQELEHRSCTNQRSLVTVRLHENLAGAGFPGECDRWSSSRKDRVEILLKCQATPGNCLGLGTKLALE